MTELVLALDTVLLLMLSIGAKNAKNAPTGTKQVMYGLLLLHVIALLRQIL